MEKKNISQIFSQNFTLLARDQKTALHTYEILKIVRDISLLHKFCFI